MHPLIVRLGPVEVSSYGFFLALSFILGLWLASVRARRMGLERGRIVDASFWIFLGAMAGARLYYVVQHFGDFSGRPLGALFPAPEHLGCLNGLSMYGGVIGGILAAIVFFALKRIPFLPYADALAPSVGLGIFLTRIGCFLNGCCYGLPASTCLSVHFPPASPAGRYEMAVAAHGLLPAQLFLSASGLAVLVGTLLVRTAKAPAGTSFCVMGLLSSGLSFALDFTRFYPEAERIGPLTHTQATTLVLFLIFLGLLARIRSRAGKTGATWRPSSCG